MTLNEIRKELKEIRYYYSRKQFIDSNIEYIGKNKIYEIIEKYNKAICNAPMRLYDLYVSLYKENNTQESLANEICYSVDYIGKLNQALVRFFQSQFKKMEENKNGQN